MAKIPTALLKRSPEPAASNELIARCRYTPAPATKSNHAPENNDLHQVGQVYVTAELYQWATKAEKYLWPKSHDAALKRLHPEANEDQLAQHKRIAVFKALAWSNITFDQLAKAAGTKITAIQFPEEAKLSPKSLRRQIHRAHETVALAAGIVGGISYNRRCSPACRWRRDIQLKSQQQWLSNKIAYQSKTGKQVPLGDLAAKRKAKLAELYALGKGIEKHIATGQLGWLSAVATAPAHMHPNPTHGRNTWDGTLPNEAAKWLAQIWALTRARLAKQGITVSGLWTREAHADGCPHVNFLVVYQPEHYKTVARILTEEFAYGPKALKIRRGGDVGPDEKKASFATYAMKYFMKGLSGWGEDIESDNEESTASAFGYRRFGFFGLPHLTTWREFRRMKECPNGQLLAATWRAVKRGDAAAWIGLNGGLSCRQSERPLRPLRIKPEGKKSDKIIGVADHKNGDIAHSRDPAPWRIINANLADLLTGEVTLVPNYPSSLSELWFSSNSSGEFEGPGWIDIPETWPDPSKTIENP